MCASYAEVRISKRVNYLFWYPRSTKVFTKLCLDCPQNTGPMRMGTGANGTTTGQRQWGPRDDRGESKGSWRDQDDGFHRPQDVRGDDRDRRRDDRYDGRGDYDRDKNRDRGRDREEGRDDRDRRGPRGDKNEPQRGPGSPRRERRRDEDARKERHRPRDRSVEHDREEKRRRLD